MNPFAINPRTFSTSSHLIENFRHLPVANVSDMMAHHYRASAQLKPMHDLRSNMAGPALTVKTAPGDNLLVHKALDLAAAGDIIVVDAEGQTTTAIIGEIMMNYAAKRNLGGLVIYGAIRDANELRQSRFPVYALGISPHGPAKDGPGTINTPITLGDMPIQPGDLILGDADGLVCIPAGQAEYLLQQAQEKQLAEERILADIQSGSYNTNWVDERLECLGFLP